MAMIRAVGREMKVRIAAKTMMETRAQFFNSKRPTAEAMPQTPKARKRRASKRRKAVTKGVGGGVG